MTRRHLVAELRSVGEPLTPSDLYAFVHSLPPAALAAGQDDSAVDVKLDPDTSDEDDTGLMVLLRVSWAYCLATVAVFVAAWCAVQLLSTSQLGT